MYQEPQYELIYTLENTSDSYTEFQDRAGKIHSIWAQPNSLLIIRFVFAFLVPDVRCDGRGLRVQGHSHQTLQVWYQKHVRCQIGTDYRAPTIV